MLTKCVSVIKKSQSSDNIQENKSKKTKDKNIKKSKSMDNFKETMNHMNTLIKCNTPSIIYDVIKNTNISNNIDDNAHILKNTIIDSLIESSVIDVLTHLVKHH
jgi:hypothetical protein